MENFGLDEKVSKIPLSDLTPTLDALSLQGVTQSHFKSIRCDRDVARQVAAEIKKIAIYGKKKNEAMQGVLYLCPFKKWSEEECTEELLGFASKEDWTNFTAFCTLYRKKRNGAWFYEAKSFDLMEIVPERKPSWVITALDLKVVWSMEKALGEKHVMIGGEAIQFSEPAK